MIAARKPVYVDKPAAGSLRDVVEMFRLAKVAKVPVFSSSSLRFASNSIALRNGLIGKVTRVEVGLPSGHTDFARTAPELLKKLAEVPGPPRALSKLTPSTPGWGSTAVNCSHLTLHGAGWSTF